MKRLVYVSGMPGAGKTTLAYPLAAELGYSLVTKDMLKEKLHDVLYTAGEEPDLAWSRQLGAKAAEPRRPPGRSALRLPPTVLSRATAPGPGTCPRHGRTPPGSRACPVRRARRQKFAAN